MNAFSAEFMCLIFFFAWNMLETNLQLIMKKKGFEIVIKSMMFPCKFIYYLVLKNL